MKRTLATAVSLAMVLTMLPATALAADADTPSAQSITIGSTAGDSYQSKQDGNALRMDVPNDAVLDLTSIGMTTTEAVSLGNISSSAANTIYADGENLKISLSVKGVSYTVTAAMATTDNIHWTGSGEVPDIEGVTDLPAGALANELGNTDISVAEGVLTADDRLSAPAKVHLNQDASKVYVYLYPASVETHTVTYNYGSGSYAFTVPEGSALLDAAAPSLTGQTFSGWKTADGAAVSFGSAVTANVTVYGSYTAEESDTTFEAELDKESTTNVLPISTEDDFAAFVARADEVAPGQLVQLQNDITLAGTYSSISGFQGNFDGNQKTITGGTFTAVGDNAGMFATLGAGQKVANLTLVNVKVGTTSTTYSGALVGSAGGRESSGSGQVTIQNVHVKNCDIDGRTSGGIAGYIIWTDVKYCSVTDNTSVYGFVNAGGIVGISYNNVTDCYSTISPSAILRRGGIVGNNLDNVAYITHCWCTYSATFGHSDNENIVTNCLPNVGRSTTVASFTALDFDTTYWNLAAGTGSTFKDTVIYDFGTEV